MLQLSLYFAKLASVLYINSSCFCMSVKPATSLTTGSSYIYFSKDPDYIFFVVVFFGFFFSILLLNSITVTYLPLSQELCRC